MRPKQSPFGGPKGLNTPIPKTAAPLEIERGSEIKRSRLSYSVGAVRAISIRCDGLKSAALIEVPEIQLKAQIVLFVKDLHLVARPRIETDARSVVIRMIEIEGDWSAARIENLRIADDGFLNVTNTSAEAETFQRPL